MTLLNCHGLTREQKIKLLLSTLKTGKFIIITYLMYWAFQHFHDISFSVNILLGLLTLRSREEVVSILQTTFSNPWPCKVCILIKFHRNEFPGIQVTIWTSIGSNDGNSISGPMTFADVYDRHSNSRNEHLLPFQYLLGIIYRYSHMYIHSLLDHFIFGWIINNIWFILTKAFLKKVPLNTRNINRYRYLTFMVWLHAQYIKCIHFFSK